MTVLSVDFADLERALDTTGIQCLGDLGRPDPSGDAA